MIKSRGAQAIFSVNTTLLEEILLLEPYLLKGQMKDLKVISIRLMPS